MYVYTTKGTTSPVSNSFSEKILEPKKEQSVRSTSAIGHDLKDDYSDIGKKAWIFIIFWQSMKNINFIPFQWNFFAKNLLNRNAALISDQLLSLIAHKKTKTSLEKAGLWNFMHSEVAKKVNFLKKMTVMPSSLLKNLCIDIQAGDCIRGCSIDFIHPFYNLTVLMLQTSSRPLWQCDRQLSTSKNRKKFRSVIPLKMLTTWSSNPFHLN